MTDSTATRRPVLVVGAGPTGLLLAAELQRREIPVHLIDALPAPLHWDRATVIHPRSLQIFESLGLAGKFLDAGCKVRAVRFHSGGKVLGAMDLAGCGSIYEFNLGLSEQVTESILTDYLHQEGGEVKRSSRLVGLTPHAGGVLATIDGDSGRYQVDAQWVVGCDGLHSPARELSGIGFEGHDIAKPWAVFDATLQGWTETYQATFVYMETPPVILTALPGERWRVYMRPSSAQSDLVEEATRILHIYAPDASFVDVENPTRFHCHTKAATRFRSGAVFLAGDAAHVCTPAEGHGMNRGLQDAFNLAWKLALVYQGAADPGLLDSYEAERRPAAEMVMQSGDGTEHALTMTDPVERDSRDQAIKAMLADAAARHHDVLAETELNVEYSQSPIVLGDANSGLGPGQRLPDRIEIQHPELRARRLHELAHRAGHTLMLLAGPSAAGPAVMELHNALQKQAGASNLFETAVSFGAGSDLGGLIGHFEVGAARVLGVGETTLLAVRPDGYVGLRSDGDHLNALERYRALVCAGHA